MLRKTGERWEFESELALENFAWANLESLFGLTALKRQYYSNGEICDIFAVDKKSRLVIIELKNCEDRYIVQQLTRYYHSLLNEKPFQPQVNYEHPARMVAVTPSFHRHNLVDRIYNKLEFQFLRFDILHVEQKFYLLLKDIDTSEDSRIELSYQEVNTLFSMVRVKPSFVPNFTLIKTRVTLCCFYGYHFGVIENQQLGDIEYGQIGQLSYISVTL